MVATPLSSQNAEQARRIWVEYQEQHDTSDRIGQTVGIDPVSGQVWFGESAMDIVERMDAEGCFTPLCYLRVGSDHYIRKGGHRRSTLLRER